jgi:hypothetical protein
VHDRNGGWPCYEGGDGDAIPQPAFEVAPPTQAACHALYTPEEGGTGSGSVAPLYGYRHDEAGGEAGSAITVGPKYDATSNYPEQYDGQIFIADYARDSFRTVDPKTGAATDFGTAGSWGNPVDIQIAPDGNVAYLGIGTAELREIVFTGSDHVPTVVATAGRMRVKQAPATIAFSSEGTSDPDAGDSLTYSWDFGDSSPISNDPNPSHTFTATGSFRVVLTVTDGHPGGVGEAALWIDIANTPPTVNIKAPDPSLRYSIGDRIKVDVVGHDKQDGELPPEAFSTQVILVHLGHLHYQKEFTGARGQFVVDDHLSDDTYYRLVSTATDSAGRSTTATRDVLPAKVDAAVMTVPVAGPFTLDGVDYAAPVQRQSIVGGRHEAYAPATFTAGPFTYEFRFWTDGVDVSPEQYFTWVTPDSARTYTAVYTPVVGSGPARSGVDGDVRL